MLALIGNVARAAGTAKSASKMLPGRSTKGKGGALVPQQRPRLTQFAGEAEKKKEQARPSLNKSAFFRAPTIGDPKKGATKMKTVENKVSKISEFFAKANKKRKEAFKSFTISLRAFKGRTTQTPAKSITPTRDTFICRILRREERFWN